MLAPQALLPSALKRVPLVVSMTYAPYFIRVRARTCAPGFVSVPTGKSAGKRPPSPEVTRWSPTLTSALTGIVGRSTDSVLTTAVLESQFPTGHNGDTATELIIDPARFRDVFTADLRQLESDVYGLSQRPIAAGALVEETMHVAWKDLPTWAAVGTGDKAAGADVVRSMAQRAGATITELDGSHVIMISQPDAVTEVILTALTAVTPHAG